jgi:hypothetical protein
MRYVRKVVNFGLYEAIAANTFQGIIPRALPTKKMGLLGAGIAGLGAGYALDRFRTNITDERTLSAASNKIGKSIRYIGKDPAHLLGKSIDVSSTEGKELFDADSQYDKISAEAYAKNQGFLTPLVTAGLTMGASSLLPSRRVVNLPGTRRR